MKLCYKRSYIVSANVFVTIISPSSAYIQYKNLTTIKGMLIQRISIVYTQKNLSLMI